MERAFWPTWSGYAWLVCSRQTRHCRRTGPSCCCRSERPGTCSPGKSNPIRIHSTNVETQPGAEGQSDIPVDVTRYVIRAGLHVNFSLPGPDPPTVRNCPRVTSVREIRNCSRCTQWTGFTSRPPMLLMSPPSGTIRPESDRIQCRTCRPSKPRSSATHPRR